jgi:hypothetical protein
VVSMMSILSIMGKVYFCLNFEYALPEILE